MATFLYAPGVRILVSTAKHGIIDVSDDLQRGNVTLNENQAHTVSFSLVNHRRKYDGVFTPNDRFTVQLKRVRWLRIMAGYLSRVPFFTTYPKSVDLTGECTLKRLRYHLWDPGAAATVEFLNAYTTNDQLEGQELDDSFKVKAEAVLSEIVQWKQGIHISRIPDAWLARVDALARELAPEFAVAADLLGAGATMNGLDPLNEAGTTVLRKTTTDDEGQTVSIVDQGTGYGTLPYTTTKIMQAPTRSGTASLTSESFSAPADPWWCDIRLPYMSRGQYGWGGSFQGLALSDFEKNHARSWWRNKRLLLVNPSTNQSIIVRVWNHGPDESTDRGLATSREVMEKLGIGDGQQVAIRFAKDQNAVLGSEGVTIGGDDNVTASSTGSSTSGWWRSALPSTTPTTSGNIVNEDGEPLRGSKTGLAAHVAAAMDYVWQNFPGVISIGGLGDRGNKSDHPRGFALDFMVAAGGSRAAGEELANGNAIALWFAANPNVFGTKYIIWQARSNSGAGWKGYTHPSDRTDNTALHYDHVHVSFTDAPGTGEYGGAWPGTAPGDFAGGVSDSTGGSPSPVGADFWFTTADPTSVNYVGIRALMNDVPIQPYIQTLMQQSMRSYCSAPNGDFIGWFPDYFGVYGTAARMIVRNIELRDFSMSWSDESLVTHVFTGASLTGYGSPAMQTEIEALSVETYGVATVEFPALLQALLNVDPSTTAEEAGWLSPAAILDRFGARVLKQEMGALTSKKAEFWYALQLFQENWSNQFQAAVPLTFMPELFPGMLLVLEAFGIQFYIQGVEHSWDFTSGGEGFTTTALVKAPSTFDGRGFFGLPKGGFN